MRTSTPHLSVTEVDHINRLVHMRIRPSDIGALIPREGVVLAARRAYESLEIATPSGDRPQPGGARLIRSSIVRQAYAHLLTAYQCMQILFPPMKPGVRRPEWIIHPYEEYMRICRPGLSSSSRDFITGDQFFAATLGVDSGEVGFETHRCGIRRLVLPETPGAYRTCLVCNSVGGGDVDVDGEEHRQPAPQVKYAQ